MTDMIQLTSSDGFAFDALHAAAQGPRRGGVIVVQEIFGLDRYVHEDAERWAKLGFEVIAPSMFDRQKRGFVAEHGPASMDEGRGYMMANGFDNPVHDVQACIDALKKDGPVFLVGYCYGGRIAWLAAARCEGLAAASSYYGGGIGEMADMPLHCPIICHFGRQDAHIPADTVKAAIGAAKPDLPVYVYERSGHGFNNDGGPGQGDPAEAELARQRTVELFEANGAA